jgi:hypothetical protein
LCSIFCRDIITVLLHWFKLNAPISTDVNRSVYVPFSGLLSSVTEMASSRKSMHRWFCHLQMLEVINYEHDIAPLPFFPTSQTSNFLSSCVSLCSHISRLTNE